MNYLILSDNQIIPEGYDHYYIMSAGCINAIDYCQLKGYSFSIVPENWQSEEALEEANEYVFSAKKKMLFYLTEALNSYHGTSFREGEWNILLSQWLTVFLDSIYDKYIKIQRLEKSGIEYDCSVISDALDPSLDYSEYYSRMAKEDEYHFLHYSQLIKEMHYLNSVKIKTQEVYSNHYIRKKPNKKSIIKSKIYYGVLFFLKALLGKNDKVVLHDCYIPRQTMFKIWFNHFFDITYYISGYEELFRPKLGNDIDEKWRNKKFSFEEEDDFVRIAFNVLIKEIPSAYLENFKDLTVYSKQFYRFAQQAKKIYYANCGISDDELFKRYLMNVRHKDAIFCDIQHGGNFGIDKHEVMTNEYEICDVFHTWGWEPKNETICQFKKMPVAKLLGEKNDDCLTTDNKRILYVNYICSKNVIRLFPQEYFYYDIKEEELQFLKKLDDKIKERFFVRLYHDDYGWKTKSVFEDSIKGLNFDSETDYYNSLKKSSLIVTSELSTTFMEALYFNKPVLVKRNFCHMTEYAKQDLQKLERVGVLATTWDGLLTQLTVAEKDINAWWNEDERKRVVNEFKEKYLYMPENAIEIWEKEITNLQ